MENKQYFEVAAKCGHVGRGYYYEGRFFVEAGSASLAAMLIRQAPRVKHDHKDAILWVKKVDHDDYVRGCAAMEQNPYSHIKSSREQDEIMSLIEGDIYPETEREINYRKRRNKYYDRVVTKRSKGIRNKYKYEKYNRKYDLRNDGDYLDEIA